MKKYENITRTHLTPRTPVIIRIDGRAFHSFTKGFIKPFDETLVKSMQDTMKYLCENIQGCVLGYTQSDEISLVLTDYKTLNTNSWFDYNIQKCVSIASSMATLAFNRAFQNHALKWLQENIELTNASPQFAKTKEAYLKGLENQATFDARIFNIPKEEVCNCILWRQQDATRNSIQMLARTLFSHKQLEHKSCDEIQEMMFEKFEINWNDTPTHLKRGSCCIRKPNPENPVRNPWTIDMEIPKFVNENRQYIESLI